MAGLLVIATVGGQDIQGPLADQYVGQRTGLQHKVSARALARELAGLPDAALLELVGREDVRNEPCFAELDRRSPGGWTLALLATDQQDPQHQGSDTFELAEILGRWASLTWPGVWVLKPYRITTRQPNLASDELRNEIATLARAAIRETTPDEVAVLPTGGTPAMRLFTELAASELHPSGRLTCLMPDTSTPGGFHEHSLLRVIQAKQVRESFVASLKEAAEGGRYRAAGMQAKQIRELDLLTASDTDRLTALCELAGRITEDLKPWVTARLRDRIDPETAAEVTAVQTQGDTTGLWEARVQARIALVRRDAQAKQWRDAVGQWVVTSEFFPVVWATRHVTEDELASLKPSREPASEDCFRRGQRRLPPPAKLWAGTGLVGIAQAAAMCAMLRCEVCPLTREASRSPAGRLMADPDGARVASLLRETGKRIAGRKDRPRRVKDLRDDWYHADDPRQERNVQAAVANDRKELERLDIPVQDGLAAPLAADFERLTGRKPADPFTPINRTIEQVLRGLVW